MCLIKQILIQTLICVIIEYFEKQCRKGTNSLLTILVIILK